uniref:Uncharacterized protein n=1 Tax=Salix viminalis TaxID=40686 RepID=A0A6N2M7M4_SALVM
MTPPTLEFKDDVDNYKEGVKYGVMQCFKALSLLLENMDQQTKNSWRDYLVHMKSHFKHYLELY